MVFTHQTLTYNRNVLLPGPLITQLDTV